MSTQVKWILKILVGLIALFLLLYLGVWWKMRTLMRVARTRTELASYPLASSNYFETFGRWPQSISEFTNNSSNIVFIASTTPNKDAWGRAILYEPFDPRRGYGRVLSYGRDGQPGGDGPDADIEFRFGK
jgi:Type II secretion system (T2SS), protein G